MKNIMYYIRFYILKLKLIYEFIETKYPLCVVHKWINFELSKIKFHMLRLFYLFV